MGIAIHSYIIFKLKAGHNILSRYLILIKVSVA